MTRPPRIPIALPTIFVVLAATAAAASAASPAARVAVLTFDAAWSDEGAGSILDALKERGLKATFFLAGRFVVRFPALARRIAEEGHEAATGRALTPLWRAPYGETNAEIDAWAGEAGYTHVPWTEGLDALDWVSDESSRLYQSPETALARLLRRLAARDGAEGPAFVLMHLGSSRPEGERFAGALPALIDGARALGYRFETASEALAEGNTR